MVDSRVDKVEERMRQFRINRHVSLKNLRKTLKKTPAKYIRRILAICKSGIKISSKVVTGQG